MQITLANPRGFCAGVDRAIEIVNRALDVFGPPIYVRHEVVHNKFVVEGLRARGAIFVEELDQVPDDVIVIAIVASGWMVWLLRKHARETLFCLGLAMILGGAIGNVIDRLLVGAVVDFLDFHAFGHHWPAFNVADMGISCGAAALIWDALRPKRGHAV